MPPPWQGNWTAHVIARQAGPADRFFAFDAQWYQRIADEGYQWNPAHPDIKQDVAFFPLWPAVLRAVALAVPDREAARWGAVALAALFGAASMCAFHRLAGRLLPPADAAAATFLFALWPGASFLLLSYPTGLMNLLCVASLLAMLGARPLVAAGFAGLVAASGPLGLATGITVWLCEAARLHRARALATPRSLAWLAVLGLVASAGLWLFLAWQWVRFGTPFAFMAAQEAWALPLPWLRRIPRLLVQALILPDFVMAGRYFLRAVQGGTRIEVQAALEQAFNQAALGLALIATVATRRLGATVVTWQAVVALLMFMWFHSVSRPGNSTERLIYCVPALFLGLAWMLRARPRLRACAVAGFALLLAANAFLVCAGYHVT